MNAPTAVLLIRVGGQLAALPLADIVETLRPLPWVAVPGAPPFVIGVAVIRGEPVTVVDLACLIGAAAQPVTRFVTVRAGARRVALAVEAVVGTSTLAPQGLVDRPPLLGAGGEMVRALGTLDRQLLLVLEGARAWGNLIPAPAAGSGA